MVIKKLLRQTRPDVVLIHKNKREALDRKDIESI